MTDPKLVDAPEMAGGGPESSNAMTDAERGEPQSAVSGDEILNRITAWFERFVAVTDPDDLYTLALWTSHTYLVEELFTTPRLQIDSAIYASGKTTVLDHLNALCFAPIQAANLSSSALIPRMLSGRMRTILLDEVDRSLSPNKPGVEELLAILNSGYRFGSTRPVLVPGGKGGAWDVEEMPTYAPVAMAGNSPRLPDDTSSRSIRILLMPDLDGTVEESDWERIGDEAGGLRAEIAVWTDTVREQVKGMQVSLPARCVGRSREKWRPLKRVAVAAGGAWPQIADRLIEKSLAEDEAERAAGLRAQPPGMVLLVDLHNVWPEGHSFVPTSDLVPRLIAHNLAYWGTASSYGKQLTDQRLGRLLSQSAKITSSRPGGGGTPRGYLLSQLEPVWRRLGIGQNQPGRTGRNGQSGQTATAPRGQTDRFSIGSSEDADEPN